MGTHKRAVIFAADFDDLQLFHRLIRLWDAGWTVDVAARTKEEIGGEHGYTLKPDVSIDEVDPDKYDVFVIPWAAVKGVDGARLRREKKGDQCNLKNAP